MLQLPRSGGRLLALVAVAAAAPGAARADGPPITWRTDYAAASQEARDKGVPLVVEVGTESCFYCRKQDATTFAHPLVARLVNRRFVPLRMDANHHPAFAEALRVKVYPTTVFASPDGKILVYHEGFLSADEFREKAKQVVPVSATDE